MTDRELAVREEFALPAQASVEAQLAEIEVFQRLVKNRLIDGHDFGIIPGTQKPTMLLPGAQKITKLAKCRPHYIVLREVEEWDREPQPLFAYTIQCQLIYLPTGEIVDEGVGECNSMESKYRWRQRERECPECGQAAIIKGKAEYGGGWLCFRKKNGCGAKFNDNDPAIVDQPTGRVLNPDIADQNNTILKMAKKRALVDAALSLGSLADLFTQDLEDVARAEPETATDVRSSPAEPISADVGSEEPTDAPLRAPRNGRPISEPAGTEQPVVISTEGLTPEQIKAGQEIAERHGLTETDSDSAFFPPEFNPADNTPKITSEAQLWKALKGFFGLNKKQHTAAVEKLIGQSLAETTNLQWVLETVANEHKERTYRKQQAEQIENTEA